MTDCTQELFQFPSLIAAKSRRVSPEATSAATGACCSCASRPASGSGRRAGPGAGRSKAPALYRPRAGRALRQRIYGLALGYEDLNDHATLRRDLAWQTALERAEELASSPTLCRLEKTGSTDRRLLLSPSAGGEVYRVVWSGAHRVDPRFRRDRRPGAWPAGGPRLSRLLRRLVLFAALRFLRRAVAGATAAPSVARSENYLSRRLGLLPLEDAALVRTPRACSISSAWPKTRGSRRCSRRFWPRPRRSTGRRRKKFGSSPISIMRRALGTRRAGSSPRPSTPRRAATRASSSPTSKAARRRSTTNCTARAARWKTGSRNSNSGSSPTGPVAAAGGPPVPAAPFLLRLCLVEAIRRLGLAGTELARAQVETIRLKLLKIGTVILRNTRRIRLLFSSAYPHQNLFRHVCQRLSSA